MYKVIITKSKNAKKKYDATIYKNNRRITKVSFGATGYEDYTMHNDKKRKKNYIARHSVNEENWDNIASAGFWSRWLLWNKKTIEDSAKDIENRFKDIKIYLNGVL